MFALARTRRSRLGGVVSAWAAAVFTLWLGTVFLCPGTSCSVPVIDQALLRILHGSQTPGLSAFFAGATWLGSITILLPLSLALAWHCHRRGHVRAAVMLPLAVGGAWLLAHLGKVMVLRPRPDLYPALIAMPADLSFPSAHAMQVAAFAVALALMPGLPRRGVVVTAMALLVLVVALSRLYLQVHFPSDVLFGVVAGAAWAMGLQRLMEVQR